ncbi:Vacuolar-sorting receptor 1 [Ancistrocladus abbreviatus]
MLFGACVGWATVPKSLRDVYECAIGNFWGSQIWRNHGGHCWFIQNPIKRHAGSCSGFDTTIKSKAGGWEARIDIFLLADPGGWSLNFIQAVSLDANGFLTLSHGL